VNSTQHYLYYRACLTLQQVVANHTHHSTKRGNKAPKKERKKERRISLRIKSLRTHSQDISLEFIRNGISINIDSGWEVLML